MSNLSNHTSTLISLLTLILFLETVLGSYDCLSTSNFTANDPYDANLVELTNYLAYVTPLTGNSLGSKGHEQHKIYGLSTCLGNYTTLDCKNCILNAATSLRAACPNNKGAVQWKGSCVLKYLDYDFFGKAENSTTVRTGAQANVSDPMTSNYMGKVRGFLSNLIVQTFELPSMSCIQTVTVGAIDRDIEGMVYCTADITSAECKDCLDNSVKLLPQCCYGKTQAVVFGGSCIVAYQVY